MFYTTIIIPVFNHGNLFKRCLESLDIQTQKNFNIVVVDDGSKPPLKNIYESFISKLNIEYFFINNTGYPSEPRNYAIKNIHTPYITFLDSDDFFHPNMIEELYKKIIEDNNASDLIHTFSYEFLEKDSTVIALNEGKYKKYDFFEMIKEGNKIVLSSVTMKLESFNKLGKFKKIRWEDFNLYLSMAAQKMKFTCINKPLVYHSISDRYQNKKRRTNKGYLFTNNRIRKIERMSLPIWSISYLAKNSSLFKYKFKLVISLIFSSLVRYRYGLLNYRKVFLIILFSLHHSIKKNFKKIMKSNYG